MGEEYYTINAIYGTRGCGKSFHELLKELKEKDKETKRLNNIIKDIKSQLDYLETYSSKEDVFEDMKRRLDRIDKIISSIRI